MYEQAIQQLDSMGIPYTENEDGTMVIDISGADKTDVVTIVGFLNDAAISYTITADSITLTIPMEAPMEEPMEGELSEGSGTPDMSSMGGYF